MMKIKGDATREPQLPGGRDATHAATDPVSRREALKSAGLGVAAISLVAVPLGLAATARRAFAQASVTPTAALQLAAKLKYLEATFYTQGAAAFASGTQAFTAGESSAIQQVLKHENAQVALLQTVLGSNAPVRPAASAYDFTAGSGTNTGPFPASLTTKTEFLKIAQLFEDLGVRALKGQLPAFLGDANMTTMMQIHQVEARHAAEIRRLRGQNGWITAASFDAGYTGSSSTAGTQASVALKVYGAPVTDPLTLAVSEDNRVQGGIASQPADAFDEPLSTTDAMTVLALFGVS